VSHHLKNLSHFFERFPKDQKYIIIIIVCIWSILKPPTGMGVVWYGRYGSKNAVPLGVVNGVNAPSRALVFPRNRCGPSLQHLTVTDLHMPKNVKTLYRGRLNAKLMLFPCDHGSSVSNIIGQLFKPKNGGWRLLRTEEKNVLKAEKMMCCKVVFSDVDLCMLISRIHMNSCHGSILHCKLQYIMLIPSHSWFKLQKQND